MPYHFKFPCYVPVSIDKTKAEQTKHELLVEGTNVEEPKVKEIFLFVINKPNPSLLLLSWPLMIRVGNHFNPLPS